ncbi:hypothetical protein B1812_04450 [Methylocystis bryophila]|uniref:Luciferase-like domain-containing protein n=1 Tax=Methylocystis bryophila TaxID=655015 RepID=A0A1W6MSD5_9HYPH|nr:hypothetical protein B1812_04450 [Methylocystis bryophila]
MWCVPTHGDSRYLGARRASDHYLRQIAVAADSLGYYGVLLFAGRSRKDPWIVAASFFDLA